MSQFCNAASSGKSPVFSSSQHGVQFGLARLRYYMPSRVWRVSGLTSFLSAKVHQTQLIVFASGLAERKTETRKSYAGRAIRTWQGSLFHGRVRIILVSLSPSRMVSCSMLPTGLNSVLINAMIGWVETVPDSQSYTAAVFTERQMIYWDIIPYACSLHLYTLCDDDCATEHPAMTYRKRWLVNGFCKQRVVEESWHDKGATPLQSSRPPPPVTPSISMRIFYNSRSYLREEHGVRNFSSYTLALNAAAAITQNMRPFAHWPLAVLLGHASASRYVVLKPKLLGTDCL